MGIFVFQIMMNHLDSVRVKHETGVGGVVNGVAGMFDLNAPLADFVRLKCGRVDASLLVDGAIEKPSGRGDGYHLDLTASSAVGVGVHLETEQERN